MLYPRAKIGKRLSDSFTKAGKGGKCRKENRSKERAIIEQCDTIIDSLFMCTYEHVRTHRDTIKRFRLNPNNLCIRHIRSLTLMFDVRLLLFLIFANHMEHSKYISRVC